MKIKELINQTFTFVEKDNTFGLISCLKMNVDVSLIDLIDERGYTLLHEACFQNLEDMV